MQEKIQKLFDKKIIRIREEELEGLSSINNMVALQRSGIYHLDVEFEDGSTEEFLWKVKSNDVIKNGINLVSGKTLSLKLDLILNRKILGYNESYLREDAIYRAIDPALKTDMIEYFGCFTDRKNRTENLIYRYYSGKERVMDREGFYDILAHIIPFHVRYMERPREAEELMMNIYGEKDYRKARHCLHAMFDLRKEENLRSYGEAREARLHDFIDRIHTEYTRFGAFRTFTHNDFSRRNIFLWQHGGLFYDFELAAYQIPEHDVAEILIYECHHITDKEIGDVLRVYYQDLCTASGYDLPEEEYRKRLLFCVMEFVVNRLSLLRIVSETIPMDFIDDILVNTNRLMDLLGESEA